MKQSHEQALVSIIIVNYNGERLLDECLQSVEGQEYKNIEIILVDNASADNSVERVQTKFPHVKIIRSDKNLGFAGGNNLGAQSASGEYLVLLNNDTVVDKAWLVELIMTMKENNAGLVTSKVITENVPVKYYEMNGSVNFIGYNIMRVFSDLSMIFFAGGASLILHNDRSGNVFPDEYFLYQEDVFLSWKMRLMGQKVMMSQRSIVHHKGSATTKKQLSLFSTFYQERNRLLNTLIFFEAATLIKLFPYLIADGLVKSFLSIIGRGKSFVGILRSYGWIVVHAGWILRERKRIQSERTVNDSEILRLMSYKVIDSDNIAAGIINRISKAYSSIAGLQYHD